MQRIKFAPVGPISIMQHLIEEYSNFCGGYHLLLAHDVLANTSGWKHFVKTVRYQHTIWRTTIIMDSSVIELGKPMTISQCVQAALEVEANVVVIPDEIGAADQGEQYLQEFSAYLVEHNTSEKVGALEFMFVPQGTNYLQYIKSLELFRPYAHLVRWIGIPRDAINKHRMNSRSELVQIVNMMYPKHVIHLLGFSDKIHDDFLTARTGNNIMGIDSAVPIRAGLKGILFQLSNSNYGDRGDYWDQKDLTEEAVLNLKYVVQLLNAG